MTERSVVVISGSTRASSANTAFACTAATYPPAGATVTAWTALAGLPHFDPDLDRDPLPAPVAALRCATCWPQRTRLSCALRSTPAPFQEPSRTPWTGPLGYVQARVLPEVCTHVPIDRNAVDVNGLIADETTIRAVTRAIAAVLATVPAADSQSQ